MMPFFAHSLLCFCFLLSLLAGAGTLLCPHLRKLFFLPVEGINSILFGGISLALFILAAAFASSNFAFSLVALHSSREMELVYRLSALWCGQEGSLLLWAWGSSLAFFLFQRGTGYSYISTHSRRWLWGLQFTVMSFFLFMLITQSSPFARSPAIPADGAGLNPLLRNPAMLLHPPLLFLAYGSLSLPSCLALAFLLSERDGLPPAAGTLRHCTRPFILIGWSLLSAGIVTGAWWSYMELGWGGYWSWDPVENASLLPWLAASAQIHSGLDKKRKKTLPRYEAFLLSLTSLCAFFAAYLVRGGMVRSVHAFSGARSGLPFLAFVLLGLVFCLYAAFFPPAGNGRRLETAPGGQVAFFTSLNFLLLGGVILIGAVWPLLSGFWATNATALDENYYTTACLPFFSLLLFLLCLCLYQRGGKSLKAQMLVLPCLAGGAAGLAAFLFPLPLLAQLSIAAAAAGLLLLFQSVIRLRSWRWAASGGTHLGFILIAAAVAFSGPGKEQRDVLLRPGETTTFSGHSIVLEAIQKGLSDTAPSGFMYSRALLRIAQPEGPAAFLKPELRRYFSHPDSVLAEADVLLSFGNELYCNLIAVDEAGTASLRLSRHPFVNWLWIGAFPLCLCPLLGLFKSGTKKRKRHAAAALGQ